MTSRGVREITTGFSSGSPARPRPGSASLTGAYSAGSVPRARGLPAVFASLLGRSSLWSLSREDFRFGLRSCKQSFPVSLAQLLSPWRVRDRANGPRARREWSGECAVRFVPRCLAMVPILSRPGAELSRWPLYTTTCSAVLLRDHSEEQSVSHGVAEGHDVCRPQFTMSCFSASAASGSPPRRPASGAKAAGARRARRRESGGRASRLPCPRAVAVCFVSVFLGRSFFYRSFSPQKLQTKNKTTAGLPPRNKNSNDKLNSSISSPEEGLPQPVANAADYRGSSAAIAG